MTEIANPEPLVFERATKRFGRATALDELSLSVRRGEIFGFLGPNGAGKTTAIHLAMGFLLPTSGGGRLFGVPFARAAKVRARVGYVPDAPAHFSGTALEAVLFAAALNSHESTGVRADALELLRTLDLPASGGDVRRFSRGQAQRLALAQALVTRPDLLILDEPGSALDPNGITLLRELLLSARDRGAAIFLSSHQLHEVEQLCDRAAFLQNGRLLVSGTMSELLQEGRTALVRLRGLSPEHPFVRQHAAWLQPTGPGADTLFRIPTAEQQHFLEQAWAAGAELVSLEREHRALGELFGGPGREEQS